jgi:hypothetical protein
VTTAAAAGAACGVITADRAWGLHRAASTRGAHPRASPPWGPAQRIGRCSRTRSPPSR